MSDPLPHQSDQHLLDRLSQIERDVLSMYFSEASLKQIAWQLKITPQQVAEYKFQAMRKLGVRSNLRLILLAARLGLIPDESGVQEPG